MTKPSIKQYVFRTGARNRVPVSGTFELTPRCNLSCQMCYVHMSPEEQRARGQELTTEEWLEVSRQAVDAGMLYLLITGGEPMIRPDFLTIYRETLKMGVMVSVNTNGTLITPEIAACFAQHPPEAVNVTLYGASPETYGTLCGARGGFEQAMRGIELLRSAGVRVSLNTTFTACNAGDMEALVDFAKQEGLPIRTAAYTFPPVRNGHPACSVCLSAVEQGNLNARFDYLVTRPALRGAKAAHLRRCLEKEALRVAEGASPAERGHPSGCMAGRGLFWMAWNGDMYPCGMLSDFAASKGDFRRQWACVRDLTESIFLPAACRDCGLRGVCPSCAAVTQSNHGDSGALVEDMCTYTKTYIRAYLELAEADGLCASASQETAEGQENFVCL